MNNPIFTASEAFISSIRKQINNNKKIISKTEMYIEKTKKRNYFNTADYQSDILNAEENEQYLNTSCFTQQLKIQILDAIEQHENTCKEARDKLNELKLISNNEKLSYGLEAIAREKSKQILLDQKLKHDTLNKKRAKMGEPTQEFIPPQLSQYEEYVLNLPTVKKNETVGERKNTVGGKKATAAVRKNTVGGKNNFKNSRKQIKKRKKSLRNNK